MQLPAVPGCAKSRAWVHEKNGFLVILNRCFRIPGHELCNLSDSLAPLLRNSPVCGRCRIYAASYSGWVYQVTRWA
jgi:hypothetical protein